MRSSHIEKLILIVGIKKICFCPDGISSRKETFFRMIYLGGRKTIFPMDNFWVKYLSVACSIILFDLERLILKAFVADKIAKMIKAARINLNLVRYFRKELLINVKFHLIDIIDYSIILAKRRTVLILFGFPEQKNQLLKIHYLFF